MRSRIAIIGHFGGDTDATDGQTVKTKILYEELARSGVYEIVKVDTYHKKDRPLRLLLQSLLALVRCERVILLLSRHGMRFYFPLCWLFAKVLRRKIYHDVIAGNLADLIRKRPAFVRYLNSFRVNWVETESLRENLIRMGVGNCEVLPNFKRLHIVAEDELGDRDVRPLRLCTFSRVMPEKGIETIADIVMEINAQSAGEAFTLDIYGAVDPAQEEWFERLRARLTPSVRYLGVVPFDRSTQVLRQYFALVFPTEYYTEGVPGTIIDAYAAALPVIASKWEHFDDVIEEGTTGLGYRFGDRNDLKKRLLDVYRAPESIGEMRRSCLRRAMQYAPDTVMARVLERLREG